MAGRSRQDSAAPFARCFMISAETSFLVQETCDQRREDSASHISTIQPKGGARPPANQRARTREVYTKSCASKPPRFLGFAKACPRRSPISVYGRSFSKTSCRCAKVFCIWRRRKTARSLPRQIQSQLHSRSRRGRPFRRFLNAFPREIGDGDASS
jgi:hypothetical protein